MKKPANKTVTPIDPKLIEEFVALRLERARLHARQEEIGDEILRKLLNELEEGNDSMFIVELILTNGDVMEHIENHHPELEPINNLDDVRNWSYMAFFNLRNGD